MCAKIKVLQWNIWFKERIENILGVITELNPDIICLQEVTRNSEFNEYKDIPAMLISKLGLFGYFGSTVKFLDGYEQGNMILSKFEIVSSNTTFLSGNTNNDESYETELRSAVTSNIKINEEIITIITTHLSYRAYFKEDEYTLKENKKFLELVEKTDKTTIVAGDFNRTPDSKLVDNLSKLLKHASPEFSKNTWTTKPFEYDGFKENKLKWRLDYVFVSNNISVISSKIIKTSASDHLPILIEVEI